MAASDQAADTDAERGTQAALHNIATARGALAGLAFLVMAQPVSAAELRVTATIKPIHALVAQVMEGVGTPSLLVQGAASPHTYALKPSDARALNAADVVFRVSEQVEPFTRKIFTALPEKVKRVTLADAPGVETLPVRTGETFEAHDHGEHDHGDHDHAHDGHDHAHDAHGHDGHGPDDHDHGAQKHGAHDHSDDHDAHDVVPRDGHVWLDPENARKMVVEIARVLSQAAPEHKATFEANAARADAALAKLEADVARDMAPLKDKPYVVFHDAYQYFERRFGLTVVGSITVSPEAQPSAKRLTEIRRKLATLSASCVFAEPQFQTRLVSAVTEGTSARAGTLDPEGARIEPGPAAYDTLLRNLASDLKACLAPQS